MEMCFHGNQLSWVIKHPIISLCSKYHSPSFICLSTMLAPVISSLDEIYCTIKRKELARALQAMTDDTKMSDDNVSFTYNHSPYMLPIIGKLKLSAVCSMHSSTTCTRLGISINCKKIGKYRESDSTRSKSAANKSAKE